MLIVKEASQLTGASESSIRVWLSDESAQKKVSPALDLNNHARRLLLGSFLKVI